MSLRQKKCNHLTNIGKPKQPKERVCEECVPKGDTWVHLRTCQTCGITLCCDSSKNQHARRHFENEKHLVIMSAEEGERWMWCYEDELYVRY